MMTVIHTPIAAAVASITTDILDRVLVLHGFLAYLAVGLLCFGEAAVMLGFVLPGETAVITGGILASRNHEALPLMIVVVVVCAIAGDSIGYEVGKILGPRILTLKPMRKRAASIERGRDFLRRRGMAGVFLGRFDGVSESDGSGPRRDVRDALPPISDCQRDRQLRR